MHPASRAGRRAIYLRPDAIRQLTAHSGVPNLTQRQAAHVLGFSFNAYARILRSDGRVTDLTIAELLDVAERIAAETGQPALRFDDLFERRTAPELAAA